MDDVILHDSVHRKRIALQVKLDSILERYVLGLL